MDHEFHPTPGLGPDLEDDGAALWYGDAMARAEAALPHGSAEDRLALVWLLAEAGRDAGGLWQARLEAVSIAGQNIGDIALDVVVLPGVPESVELARRPWLIEEGRQVIELARRISGPPRNSGSAGDSSGPSLIDFSTIQVGACLARLRKSLELHDVLGNRFQVSRGDPTSSRLASPRQNEMKTST